MMTTAGDDFASDVKAAPVPSDDGVKPDETPVTSLTLYSRALPNRHGRTASDGTRAGTCRESSSQASPALASVRTSDTNTNPTAGTRLALVIGNSAYRQVPRLVNPRSDADLMARTLETVGFKVTKLIDADQGAMKRAMRDFGRKLKDGVDASLFYYSGHGVQVRGKNYLIPVSANIKDEDEVGLEAVDVNDFLQVMDKSTSQVKIVVLDACRDNPFATSFRSVSLGLATMVDAPRGTYIAYSTAPGKAAVDGDGKNSPYTAALAKAIMKPGLKIEETFKLTRRLVLEATHDEQLPWDTSSLIGDFYFRPPATAGTSELVNPQIAPEPAPEERGQQAALPTVAEPPQAAKILPALELPEQDEGADKGMIAGEQFKLFLQSSGIDQSVSEQDREELFKRFLKWKETPQVPEQQSALQPPQPKKDLPDVKLAAVDPLRTYCSEDYFAKEKKAQTLEGACICWGLPVGLVPGGWWTSDKS